MIVQETYSIRTLTALRNQYEPETEQYIKLTALIGLAKLREKHGTAYYQQMRNERCFVKLLGQPLNSDRPELRL